MRLVDAGINDWGGISPLTMDYVNPEAPWPHIERLRQDEAYLEAIRVRPDLPDAHHNLGYLREAQGRWEEAAARYAGALEANPFFLRSLLRLSTIRATHPDASLRDDVEALALARRALEVVGDEPGWELLDVLAAARAERGNNSGAVGTIRAALEQTDDAEVRALLLEHLALYASARPLRSSP